MLKAYDISKNIRETGRPYANKWNGEPGNQEGPRVFQEAKSLFLAVDRARKISLILETESMRKESGESVTKGALTLKQRLWKAWDPEILIVGKRRSEPFGWIISSPTNIAGNRTIPYLDCQCQYR